MPLPLTCGRPVSPFGTIFPAATADQAAWSVPRLLQSGVVWEEDWDALPAPERDRLEDLTDPARLMEGMVNVGLLTRYQADRVLTGTTAGLVMGNYRVCDRIGAGGMGVVFKAEHRMMRRPVAVKVLPARPSSDGRYLKRFRQEMRIVAALHHPNIVAALDAGLLNGVNGEPDLYFLVMEYVAGGDLEDHVANHGPMPVATACDLMAQVACALSEAHRHNLVHRDVKPSNVLLAADGRAKLVDFGLARPSERRDLTEPGCTLGTLDYMAPEQVEDARSVDIRADLFGLGATLYWLLTGKRPFAATGSPLQDLLRRHSQPPPAARSVRPEVPPSLDALLARLMAVRAEDRPAHPQAVAAALSAFAPVGRVESVQSDGARTAASAPGVHPLAAGAGDKSARRRVLIVEDEPAIATLCRMVLSAEGYDCDHAATGRDALAHVRDKDYDVVLLDSELPDRRGGALLQELIAVRRSPDQVVLTMSGRLSADELSGALMEGADDYLPKPFTHRQLAARVRNALRLREAREQTTQLNHYLMGVNAELRAQVHTTGSDQSRQRSVLVGTLTGMLRLRSPHETEAHLKRQSLYCGILAREAASSSIPAGPIDDRFIDLLTSAAPLHDVGALALPDHILLKPGRFDAEETIVMQSHTTAGAGVLEAVAARHGSADDFLQVAIELARWHHERYDGRGYPDGLAGDAIPLSARVLAVCDVYDSLRSRRSFRPALPHPAAVRVITGQLSEGHFDPRLVDAFGRCADQFRRVFAENPD